MVPGSRAVSLLIAGTLAGPPASGAEGPQAGPTPPPPGGYWELGEQREPEPKDGRQSLLVGAILTPLGLLRVGGAVSTIYVAQDGRCQTTLQANDDTCQSLRLWGYSGLGMGGLMFVTGVVFLGIGFHRRAEHDAWKRRYSISMSPLVRGQRLGATFRIQF